MTARRRIVTRTAAAPITRILRTRRGIEPVDSNGDVAAIVDGEEFSIKLLKKTPGTIDTFRVGEYLHVSDLLGKCIRKMALSERYSVKMPNGVIQESLALTFAQGNAIHDHVKRRFAQGHPDKMFGEWSCLCEKQRSKPSTLSAVGKRTCPSCGGLLTKYHELELRDPELKLVGSPDITLYLSEYPAYYPIEVKSINSDDWKELVRPIPDHVIQVLFYWYLLRKLGYPVPDQVSILYVTKGFLFKTPYKEFIVRPEGQMDRLDSYIAEARSLVAAREGGIIPARTRCSSPTCSEAKQCHLATLCFQQP